jgi:carboxyl-terminal processing protease
MYKILRSNKTIFYSLIFIWFLAGTVIFNYSIASAQVQEDINEAAKYANLFSEALFRLRVLYVEELNINELISNAIESMLKNIDTEETFINSKDYLDYIALNPINEIPSRNPSRILRYFNDILIMMKTHFGANTTYKDLIEHAIDGMMKDLDPHTNFFRPEDFRDFNTNTMGELGGLGITIDRQGDYVTVVSPMEGTPAYRMGIQAGDRIVSVDKENVVGMPTDEVIKRMRGEKDTHVLIGISRPGVDNILYFDIIRDIIKIRSVPYAFKLDNGVGYIRIRQFNAQTTTELRRALDYLEEQGITGLLIDLRFNPGGLLNEAVDTVNEFIGPNRLVVFTRGRIREANWQYHTRYNRSRSGYPVVVLINEVSASASEIFAGSMQDWDRALVVGRPSFGKGSVQNLIPLPDGYGMKVTVSKYFIKSGRGIHKDLLDRLLRGEDISEEEQERIEKETQRNIYHTVNGREVLGGGGIVPDIDIPHVNLTNLERELRRLNIFFGFSVDYFSKHKDDITLDFMPDASLINEFIEYAVSRGLTYEADELEQSYDFIRITLAKDIIDRKFGEVEGYKVAIQLDSQLMKAIELFDRFSTQKEMFDYATTREASGE